METVPAPLFRWGPVTAMATMTKTLLVLFFCVALSQAGRRKHYRDHVHCRQVYETHHGEECHTVHEKKCHQISEKVCHTEYDTVINVEHHQDCQDIVTEKCHTVEQTVAHTSHVVGHSSKLVHSGHAEHIGHAAVGHLGKRDADAAHGHHVAAPQCVAHT